MLTRADAWDERARFLQVICCITRVENQRRVEEAEEDKRLQKEKRKRKADLIETMQIIGIAGGGVLAVFLICFTLLTIWVR